MRGAATSLSLRSVLLLLVVVVVVPTACVLWFMVAAVENERLAFEQRLTAAYRSEFVGLDAGLRQAWDAKARELASIEVDRAAAEVFADLIRRGVADSVVLREPSGEARYPREASTSDSFSASPGWLEAQRLEFAAGEPSAAALAYERIADTGENVALIARALRAQARCLTKAGELEAAATILTEKLAEERFRHVRDSGGRSIVADGQLLALRLMSAGSPDFESTVERLASLVNGYAEPTLPSNQRRFLMRELALVAPAKATDMLAAEDLAAAYIAENSTLAKSARLTLSEVPGVWHLASTDGRVVALFREETVRAGVALSETQVELLPPRTTSPLEENVLTHPTGGLLAGWRLSRSVPASGLLASAAGGKALVYLWSGALVILAIVVLGFVVARSIGRQMRITRLKNELIDTVSHELKTPLAGMRLLVDTLLERDRHDEAQAREYLQLISKENERLSSLIESFLTFSRLERNKQVLVKTELAPADLVATAADSLRARCDAKHCSFEVDVAADLPAIIGDPDALSTVLVNLLDNAYKYSNDEKRIVLRSYPKNGDVFFEVQDNGIGMSRRAAKNIFERFYQVDRRLARDASGVGLGLSIVKFIVNAHGGAVSVASQAGEGSTFTVRLPAAGVQ